MSMRNYVLEVMVANDIRERSNKERDETVFYPRPLLRPKQTLEQPPLNQISHS